MNAEQNIELEPSLDKDGAGCAETLIASLFPEQTTKGQANLETVSAPDDDRGYFSERLNGRVWIPGTSEREANRIARGITEQLRVPGGLVTLDVDEIRRTALSVPNLDTFVSQLTRRLAANGLSAQIITVTNPLPRGQENSLLGPSRSQYLQFNGFTQPVRIQLWRR